MAPPGSSAQGRLMNMMRSIEEDGSYSSDGYDQRSDGSESGHGVRLPSERRHDAKTEIEKLSMKETKRVRAWRMIVLISLLLAGAVVSTGTYLFLKREEEDDVKDSYKLFAHSLYEASRTQMEDVAYSLRALSESVTSSCMVSGSKFPFCTVPMIEVEGTHARVKSGLEAVFLAPIVELSQMEDWHNYSVANQGWIEESRNIVLSEDHTLQTSSYQEGLITPFIYERDENRNQVLARGPGPFAPFWQMSPPPFNPSSWPNYNSLTETEVDRMYQVSRSSRGLVVSHSGADLTLIRLDGTALDPSEHIQFHKQFVEELNGESAFDHPHAVLVQPIFEQLNDPSSAMVGFIMGVLPWDMFFANVLPPGVSGIYGVLKNTCGETFSYVLNGDKAMYLGVGDYHDEDYDDTEQVVSLQQADEPDPSPGHCVYELRVYSSDEFEVTSSSLDLPLVFTVCVALTFFLMAMVFFMYDSFVRRRNAVVLDAAARSNAILSNLFPTNIRDRLFADKEQTEPSRHNYAAPKSQLKNFLVSGEFIDETQNGEGDDDADFVFRSKPIADLFPETTILFSDLAGFTAWSSVREPSQVFILLETLYHAFDEIAKKRRVFKVETVGDCYVAVTGLPDPQKDHAVSMARFARECIFKTRYLTKKLEVTLGPDTGDLAMRTGIHSGPVTAGVLRGERSRFQLFGDTMNTAARMEQTGLRDHIQISQETADLLVAAGKQAWIKKRDDKVVAKGKGEMQTYWLLLGSEKAEEHGSSRQSSEVDEVDNNTKIDTETEQLAREIYDGKTARLIDWNVDVLTRLLKQVAARRASTVSPHEAAPPNEERYKNKGRPVMDEVKEIIVLPNFNANTMEQNKDPDKVELGDKVMEQLHDFVCNIAALYRDNPFHNFEHASHVTMSVVKLLSRIVAPSDIEFEESQPGNIMSTLHDHTYGITSDPLTQFACVFSALIHDIDHTGVPNTQLVKENVKISAYYKNKSVAEQNSVDLAWTLLMDDNYVDLRRVIYRTDGELRRFRQLVVNSVMATDIVDKELKALRNLRWDRAFSDAASVVDPRDDTNRKATIVIEHLIQASDVSHTMQHWHIYRKWNERFFCECYRAYKAGRAEKDPSLTWYQGELGFFDFYIIPLAKKLKDCGVFGVSSDEYLNYAMRNRKEWEERGREVVDEMLEQANKES